MAPNDRLLTDCIGDVPNEGDRVEFGMVSGNLDHLANLLSLGSFFIVQSELGNIEEVPYYLLQCTWPLETLQEFFTQPWDETVYEVVDKIVT